MDCKEEKWEECSNRERRGSEKQRRGGVWGEKGGRKGIPPTESLVERFWGLGRSQETVVAPAQASHRAALGHPVTDRQTHQMAWLGPNRQGFVYFSSFSDGGGIVQHKLFIGPLIFFFFSCVSIHLEGMCKHNSDMYIVLRLEGRGH